MNLKVVECSINHRTEMPLPLPPTVLC